MLTDALSAAHEQGWEFEVNGRLAQTHLYHAVALVVFALATFQLPGIGGGAAARLAKVGVEVMPGHTEIERGTSLIVSAKFGDFRSDVKLTVQEQGQAPRWMTDGARASTTRLTATAWPTCSRTPCTAWFTTEQQGERYQVVGVRVPGA